MVSSTSKRIPKRASMPIHSAHQDTPETAVPYRIAALIGLAALLFAVGLAVAPHRNGRDGAVTLAVDGSPDGLARGSADAELSQDERLRRAAIGTWQDFYQGKRTLTLREDGTATMVVKLTGMKARLFTPRLELDIVWSIEDGRMTRRTVGGTPADKVAFVNNRAGRQVTESILELTDDRLQLLDQNGQLTYHWRRVP